MAEQKTVDRTQETTKTTTEEEKNIKLRNYAFIVYPDSTKLNAKWRENIDLWGHKAIISPLHDKDTYDSDIYDDEGNIKHQKGELKKPHYHVCVFRENATTLNSCKRNAKKDVDSTIDYVEILRGTILSSYEYMSHKNAPSKAQYNQEEVVCLNGFNPFDYIKQSRSDKLNLTKEIYTYIENNGLEEFSDLIQLLIMEEKDELLEYVSNRAFFVDKILSSMRYKKPKNSGTHKKE